MDESVFVEVAGHDLCLHWPAIRRFLLMLSFLSWCASPVEFPALFALELLPLQPVMPHPIRTPSCIDLEEP
jgi:hypothetical protein